MAYSLVFGERSRSQNAMVEEIVPSSAWTEESEGHYLLLDIPGFNKEDVKFEIGDSGYMTISGERLVKDGKIIVFEQTFKIPENSDTDEIIGNLDGGILHVIVPKQPANRHGEEARSPNTDSIDQEENVEAKNVEKQNKDEQVDHDHHEQVKQDKAKEDDHHRKDGFPKEVAERSQEVKQDKAKEDDHHRKDGFPKEVAERSQEGHEDGFPKEVVKRSQEGHEDGFPKEAGERSQEGNELLALAMQMLKKHKGIVSIIVLAFSLGFFVGHWF